MKKILFAILLISLTSFGYSKVWTISSAGFTFSPSVLTISVGDSVNFSIAAIHTALEVDFATWSANDVIPLSGGFSVPLGGGIVPAAKLPLGNHYYVCTVHVATMGMKGTIVVQNPTGIKLNLTDKNNISVYPNPANTMLHLDMNITDSQQARLKIVNLNGQELMDEQIENGVNNFDIEKLDAGLYFVLVSVNNKQIYGSKIQILNK
jgi:plastocyanin